MFLQRVGLSRRFFSTGSSPLALVVGEVSKGKLNQATLSAITAANHLGGKVHVLLPGDNADDIAKEVANLEGVSENPVAENVSNLVLALQEKKKYSHILTGATSLGKGHMPRTAAKLGVSQISEIISVEGADSFRRPIYAGNAIATLKSTDAVKCITVRGTAFDKAGNVGSNAPVTAAEVPGAVAYAVFVSAEQKTSDKPDLQTAPAVISGGRGMKSGENFAMLEELAGHFGAAVGASRAAVDAGFVSNDLQVGQTGKVVAPNLYVAVGISGAIQHLAGMKDSKTIVAINKDPEAPIFTVADYGLVADLFTAVPELNKTLSSK